MKIDMKVNGKKKSYSIGRTNALIILFVVCILLLLYSIAKGQSNVAGWHSDLACRDHCGAQVETRLVDKLKILEKEYGSLPTITSGKRCAKRNAQAGGAKRSQHLLGLAVDFSVKGTQAKKKFIAAANKAGFTGIGVDWDGRLVHIDLGPKRTWAY